MPIRPVSGSRVSEVYKAKEGLSVGLNPEPTGLYKVRAWVGKGGEHHLSPFFVPATLFRIVFFSSLIVLPSKLGMCVCVTTGWGEMKGYSPVSEPSFSYQHKLAVLAHDPGCAWALRARVSPARICACTHVFLRHPSGAFDRVRSWVSVRACTRAHAHDGLAWPCMCGFNWIFAYDDIWANP